jgi:chaperonin GroEL (HSP60 family)
MNFKQGGGSEVDESLAALMTNAQAVRAIAAAVQGTIGPKGLDTMLVDRFGEVIITNDGVTILDKMDVNHPAAKMVINIAKAQQHEVGDGTTTATIMAGALVNEGVAQVLKGVPVARVIEGIRLGISSAQVELGKRARQFKELKDPKLSNIAMVAGRENVDIADLVVQAARLIGREKLLEANYKLSDIIVAEENAQNEVFMGVIVDKERMSKEMPEQVENALVMIIDDALEPEELDNEALGTEAGFRRFRELQDEFEANVRKIVDLDVKAVLTDRGVHAKAEEILTDAQILVVQRVPANELRRVAEHVGARMIKRTGLKKDSADLQKLVGFAEKIYEDEKLEHIRIMGGRGKPAATILVGAATQEVVGERQRIARDAASSVQAAVRGGYVAGGGAVEVAIARAIEKSRGNLKGMSAYGLDCVVNALKRPLAQIVENAGYNPLEKVEDIVAAQNDKKSDSLGIDCDTGEVCDMVKLGVIDPAPVKLHALKAAGEVATAILRIDTIIRKKDEGEQAGRPVGGETPSSSPDF